MILAQITNVTSTITAPDVASDLVKLLHDVGYNINPTTIATIVVGIFTVARILRKAIPDASQTGKAGELLKHLALEINPQTGASTTQPNKPTPTPL